MKIALWFNTSFVMSLLLGLACSSATGAELMPVPFTPHPPVDAIAKGNRILGLDINIAENDDYEAAFTLAQATGMELVSLTQNWENIETGPSEYNANPNNLQIANLYYPAKNTKLNLFINPIDTNGRHTPPDLTALPLDDPVVIERFNAMLDYAFSQIPAVQLNFLAIGNEVDLGIGADKELWRQYIAFFQAVKAHLKTAKPNLKVGAVATLYGLTDNFQVELQSLNQHTDLLIVSYYPLNDDFSVKEPTVVTPEVEALVKLYPNRSIQFSEVGYPSGEGLNSSEVKQAQFVQETFKVWDKHAAQIEHITFAWLTDLPQSAVDHYTGYYTLSDVKFQEYLRTLGLRSYEGVGQDKLAFQTLKIEAKARGW